MPNVDGGIVEFFDATHDRQTYTAAGTITGGQLVELNGNRTVVTATLASVKCIGVALHNAVSGEKVVVAHQGVWPIAAGAGTPVAAGDRCVVAGTAGAVGPAGATPDARTLVAIAEEAISAGNSGRIKLKLG